MPDKVTKAQIFNSKRSQYLVDYPRIWSEAEIIIVPQVPGKVGDLPAITSALPYIYDSNAIVAFGDGLFEKNAIAQAVEAFNGNPLVVLSTVPQEQVGSFGIAKYEKPEEGNLKIEKFIEKPKPDQAPSTEAAVGVYVITPPLISKSYEIEAGKDGEYRLADLLGYYLENKGSVDGIILDGWWGDTGNPLNLAKTRLLMALRDPNMAKEIKDLIQSI